MVIGLTSNKKKGSLGSLFHETCPTTVFWQNLVGFRFLGLGSPNPGIEGRAGICGIFFATLFFLGFGPQL